MQPNVRCPQRWHLRARFNGGFSDPEGFSNLSNPTEHFCSVFFSSLGAAESAPGSQTRHRAAPQGQGALPAQPSPGSELPVAAAGAVCRGKETSVGKESAWGNNQLLHADSSLSSPQRFHFCQPQRTGRCADNSNSSALLQPRLALLEAFLVCF